MNKEAWKLNVNDKGIATLTLDVPDEKVNILSFEVLQQLDRYLDQLKNDPQVKALVIRSGKRDTFIAGANLHEFESGFKDPSFIEKALSTGQGVFRKLASLPFPTIALIHGICVGGGLELALACKYRLVSDHPKTSLGLPETTIGIYPGWGGTQRLPRLVGLIEAIQMITSGRPVNGSKAVKIKLADELFANEFADDKLNAFLGKCLSEKGRKQIQDKRKLTGLKHWLIESNPLGRSYLFKKAEKEILSKTKGHYPAPLIALKVIEDTQGLSLDKGLEQERASFVESVPRLTPVARKLIHLFFVQEALKKVTGAPEGTKPAKVTNVGVIGAGTMGVGIAYLCSNANFSVRLKDVSWEILSKAFASISKIYHKLVEKRKLRPHEANLKMHLISATTDYSGFKTVDLAIEAATENLTLKYEIFSDLEKNLSPQAMIASNTSSLTIAEMSKNMQHPERFVGMHFFNPADRMPLVEIVPGKKTSPEIVAGAVDFCRKLGKTPIVVQDCAGFLVNRIFVLGANEVIQMLQEGVPMKRLEEVLLNFGLPMSPFELGDEVGNDVSYKVSKIFEKAYGERMAPPALLESMYNEKLFGKKVGKGFYIYNGKDKNENPEIQKLLKPLQKETRQISDDEIIERVLYLMINESWKCLDEGIVDNPDTIDLAMIMGTGFPPFRGGPMQYAQDVGEAKVIDRLKHYESLYGPRFATTHKP
jgi:3-hydroxyacyl-CoA dehydrogenase / enoyl-CoA hydratase / 3-hydroxybutyryl-CoA epimerase